MQESKARPFRADRPDTFTYMGPIISLKQCDMFIRFQNKASMLYPVGGPGRHKVQLKSPHTSAKIVKWGNHSFQKQSGVMLCNVGEAEGRGAPEAVRPPKIEASEETTQRTDVQGRSRAVHRMSVARWHTPRSAGLGRAARPHLAASRLPASRGS